MGTDTGKVYMVATSDGGSTEVFTAEGGIYSTPAIDDGVAYIGTATGNIYALDLLGQVDGNIAQRQDTELVFNPRAGLVLQPDGAAAAGAKRLGAPHSFYPHPGLVGGMVPPTGCICTRNHERFHSSQSHTASGQ